MTVGVSPAQADLLKGTAVFCDGRVGEGSIWAVLHRECHRLFPDEMFADLGAAYRAAVRALADAGLKTGDGGLQFSLRDQSSSGQNGGNESGRNAQRLIISEEDAVPAVTAQRSYGRMLGSNRGVDIRI